MLQAVLQGVLDYIQHFLPFYWSLKFSGIDYLDPEAMNEYLIAKFGLDVPSRPR